MIPERLIRSLFVFLILFTSGSLAAATDFGDPRGFLSNESVVEKALRSGGGLYEGRGNDGDRAQTIYVVKADGSQPHLNLRALAGERQAFGTQYFARSTVSQLHEDNDAFVTINSAFFDISNPGTQMPTGALLQNKKLLRSPTEGQNILIVDDENQPKVAAIRSANRIRSGDVIRPVLGVNLNSIGADDLIVYQRPWHRSPGND